MQFFIDNWMLIAVAFASGAMLLWPVVQGATGGGLSTANAVQLINRERAVVVDVSETEEFAQGHANRALAVAKKLGYEKAQVLAGGLKAWKEANLPVEKA